MANITRENIGILNDKLTVSLNKEDYYPAFDKAIKDYSKKANIPGFRKGMVPTGMVKKMYGASIYYDEVIKVVEKKLQEYLIEQKPSIFGQPLPMETDLRNLDMNEPVDYSFHFEIGLKPEININSFASDTMTFHKVSVTDEMIEAEIGRAKLKFGKTTEPETVTSENDVLNILFTETDAEGVEIASGIEKENSLSVKFFSPEFRPQLMGKTKGDILIVPLSHAFEDKEKEWIANDIGINKGEIDSGKYFRITILKIELVVERSLNAEFYQEVFPGKNIETEEDFRTEFKSQLQTHWDAQSRVQLQDQIYHSFLNLPIELPEAFLRNWLARGGEKVKSQEEVDKEFPTFRKQLIWTLISDKITIENNLEVSEAELRENMKLEIMQYFGQTTMAGDTSWIESYIDRMMKEEKQVESSYHRLMTSKIFSWAEAQVKPVEKAVSPEELEALQHHHTH